MKAGVCCEGISMYEGSRTTYVMLRNPIKYEAVYFYLLICILLDAKSSVEFANLAQAFHHLPISQYQHRNSKCLASEFT